LREYIHEIKSLWSKVKGKEYF